MCIDTMFLLRNNGVKKKIVLLKNVEKELNNCSFLVRKKVKSSLNILARDGRIREPLGKKISNELFEIRIKCRGEWRVIFAYYLDDYIVILSMFHKKTQKTPLNEIKKAKNRLRRYYEQ